MEGNSNVEFVTISSRHYGLDFLRIVSMLMIVFLHACSHGGIGAYYSFSSINGVILKLLQTFSLASVNVFVLISGYFLANSHFKLSKLFVLFLETFFYSIAFLIGALVCGLTLGFKDYLTSIFPIAYKCYWFITAYFGMYLLSPLINKLIHSISRKTHLFITICLVLLYSLCRDLLPFSDPFFANNGYSVFWFVILYFISSYIKLYVQIEKIRLTWLYHLLSVFVMLALWILLSFLSEKIQFINEYSLQDHLLKYNSILNVVASVMLFITFLKINIKNKIICSIVSFISPLVLGVYLIHDNYIFRDYLWNNVLKTNKIVNDSFLIPKVLLVVFVVFFVCLTVSLLRSLLFHLFDRTKWFKKLIFKIDNLPYLIRDKM